MEGKPPQGHPNACSTVNYSPQTQLDVNRGGRQPYLRLKTSLKATLCKAKPCSDKGKAVNQLKEPDSPDNKTDLRKDEESKGSKE